jgi:tRNA A-37 threonylcarbamoyl transferase component Bud32
MLPLTPTKLGRYEIVDEIGKGAMGIVYLARDPLIGRLVALKTFRIGYSIKDQEMEQFRIRFMREAQSAGILTHPNIVTIHDVVEGSDEGLAFIAMEYVRGTNLKLMLQGEQPLTLRGVLDIIAQVGEALDYAHANRVIHRDVKPANILITAENRVKITDFGIARLDSSNLTQEGQLLGTPNYMAPEQIQGKEVDSRADLFSLGVVLYEMLTRHKPFQGENLTVVSHRIVYDHFTPLREYARDLPPGVDRILGRALEKDPARRYQRAKEMVDALRQIVEANTTRVDALNETQSLSSTMVLPPSAAPLLPPPVPAAAPAAPAPRGSFLDRLRGRSAAPPPPPALALALALAADDDAGTGSGTGTGSSAVMPAPAAPLPDGIAAGTADGTADDALADTVATEAPTLRPPGRTSPRRLLVAGGSALLVSLLLWAAALLWVGWSQPAGPQRDVAEDGNRQRIIEMLRAGKKARDVGDWKGAAVLFYQAEQLAPNAKKIREMRVAAQQNAGQQFSQQSGRDSLVAMGLDGANKALVSLNYDNALMTARTVLGLDPENVEARAILVKAQEGKARQDRQRQAAAASQDARRRKGEEIAAVTPAPSEGQPPTPSAPVTRPEATTATVHVHFRSELPEGSLILWANNQEILRDNYSSPRGGGINIFRSRKQVPYVLNRTLTVPAGTVDFRVHVAPAGNKAQVKPVSGSFQGGGSRSLDIHLAGPTQLTIQLN